MTTTPKTQTTAAQIDVGLFIADLDAGNVERQLSAALCQVAAAAVDHQKKGSVSISMEIEPIKGTHQVQVKHTIKYLRPTEAGKMAEDLTRSTPMHVGKYGRLSLAPENQLNLPGLPERKPATLQGHA